MPDETSPAAIKLLVACTVGLALSQSAIAALIFGIFMVPWEAEFGWKRGDISVGMSISTITTLILIPVVGSMIDRRGVRAMLIPMTGIYALTVATMAFLTANIIHLYAMAALMAVFGVFTTPISYSKIIVSAFKRHRGLALGIGMSGVGVGTALIPILLQHISELWNWRLAFAILGGLIMCISLPLIVAWLREPDAAIQGRAKAKVVTTAPVTIGGIVWQRTFILLTIIFFFLGIFTGGILGHLIPLLIDLGFAGQQAAASMSLIGIGLLAGRLLAGYLLDRIFGPILAVAFLAIALGGLLILALSSNTALLLPAILMVGMGIGAEMDFLSYFVSRYFDTGLYSRIYGWLYIILIIGVSIGPIIMGYGHQFTNEYAVGMSVMIISLFISIFTLLFLKEYKEL